MLKDEKLEVVRTLEPPQGWDTSRNGVSTTPALVLCSQWRLQTAHDRERGMHLHSMCTELCCEVLAWGVLTRPAIPGCSLHPLPHTCLCHLPFQDFDHTALLARETVQDGHSVLVFCGTKAACETTAKRAAR